MARAKYRIVSNYEGRPLVIEDMSRYQAGLRSVTNDADVVVQELIEDGHLGAGRRLLYYDSQGRMDEIVVKDGRFAGFKPYGAIPPENNT